MTNKEIINQMKFDMDMILFDPITGNEYPYNTLNEDNKRAYDVDREIIERFSIDESEKTNKELVKACKTHLEYGIDTVTPIEENFLELINRFEKVMGL